MREIKIHELIVMLSQLPYIEYNEKAQQKAKVLIAEAMNDIDNKEEMINFLYEYIGVVDCVRVIYDRFLDEYRLELKAPTIDGGWV